MRWNLNERPEPLQVFRDYLNIKLHFDGRFIWSPGMGQKITDKTLRDRKDSRFFEIIAEKEATRGDIVERLVSAFLWDSGFWVGSYFHEDLEVAHGKRLKYTQSIRHKFSSEFEAIVNFQKSRDLSLKKLLIGNGIPGIIQHRRTILGGVSDETLAILDHFFQFCERGESLNPLWNERRHIIARYSHFAIPGDRDFEFIEDLVSSNWLT